MCCKKKLEKTIKAYEQNLGHVYSASDTELKHKVPQPSKVISDKVNAKI